MTAALPGRSTFTVLLRWQLKNMAFCFAFGLTFLPSSCWRFTGALSALIWRVVFTFGPMQPSATSNFSTIFREERLDLSPTSTSFTNLFLSMLDAGWPPYLFYRYFHSHCANSVAEMIPRPAEIGRSLRNRVAWHPYRVHLCHARTDTYHSKLFHSVSVGEWNFLPCYVFPPEYDLQSFKRKVNNHIMTDLRNLDRTRSD